MDICPLIVMSPPILIIFLFFEEGGKARNNIIVIVSYIFRRKGNELLNKNIWNDVVILVIIFDCFDVYYQLTINKTCSIYLGARVRSVEGVSWFDTHFLRGLD